MEDEEEGLCEEERALKPLVPARVTFCDTTGAADFWANSVPAMQRSERRFKLETIDIKRLNVFYHLLLQCIKDSKYSSIKA